MFQNLNPLDKPTAIMEIVLMLLVTAVLGYFIGWLMQKFNLDKAKAENRFVNDKYNTIQTKHLALEKENREYLAAVNDLRHRKDSLLKELDDLKADNKFIEDKFKDSVSAATHNSMIDELNEKIKQLKAKNEELKVQLVEEHHTGNKIEQLEKENAALKEQLIQSKEEKPTNLIVDNNKTIEETHQPIDETENDNAVKAEEESKKEILEDKLEAVVATPVPEEKFEEAKNVIEVPQPPSNSADKAPKILSPSEINELKKKLISNLGTANEAGKNNLSKINGIGPLIEAKLNSIGIYTYQQVSKMNKDDIDLVTELIEFFPGRIERDNWIGQAKNFMNND